LRVLKDDPSQFTEAEFTLMRKFILGATPVAALAVPSIAGAAPRGVTSCIGDLASATINTNLDVSAGGTSKMVFGEANSNVTVEGHRPEFK
jgi:hypothetical protein